MSLAVSGATFAVLAWINDRDSAWLLVAFLLLGVVGFTVLVITPLYRALLEPSLAAEDPIAIELLERWGRLHHVRSAAGLVAFLIGLKAV